jgi:hypothetical protein
MRLLPHSALLRLAIGASPPGRGPKVTALPTWAASPCPADTVAASRSCGRPGTRRAARQDLGLRRHGIWVVGRLAAGVRRGRRAGQARAGLGARKSPEYIPNAGLRLYEGDKGQIYMRLFTYVRYLNQKGLDATYTDYFGVPAT